VDKSKIGGHFEASLLSRLWDVRIPIYSHDDHHRRWRVYTHNPSGGHSNPIYRDIKNWGSFCYKDDAEEHKWADDPTDHTSKKNGWRVPTQIQLTSLANKMDSQAARMLFLKTFRSCHCNCLVAIFQNVMAIVKCMYGSFIKFTEDFRNQHHDVLFDRKADLKVKDAGKKYLQKEGTVALRYLSLHYIDGMTAT
jgi:hypothetical protein